MTYKTHTLRNGIFCVVVFLACFLVAWPVAQMGFMDDWSYTNIALVFARTGHIVYNGWSVEILGWMLPWGALFIKLFGFSFMAVKLSTLPVAVATLLLFHSILRRFEISPWNAVIGTLTLGLSPLFLPLSASFMTDIPGLFVIVLCLYLCQRAVKAESDRTAIAWLVLAAATNVAGGTARQIAWLGILVMIPSTGWLLRKRRGMLATTVGLWLAGSVAVFYCMHWYVRQPYSLPTSILPGIPHTVGQGVFQVLVAADLMMAVTLCLLLMVFPLLAPWLRGLGRKTDHYLALACAGFLPLFLIKLLLGPYAVIWPQQVLYQELTTRDDAAMNTKFLLRHSLAPVPVQIVISLILIAALFGLIFALRNRGREVKREGDSTKARQMFWLLVPYSACYAGLMVILAAHGYVFGGPMGPFDRYVLGLMPCAIVGLLWIYEQRVGAKLPAYSVALVVLYALIAVAGTHDWFAWQRARLTAIGELRAAGIARANIQGGSEYDGWTQLKLGGYINDPRIEIPKGAYKARASVPDARPGCSYWFLGWIPDVSPRYSVGIVPARCYLPSRFPAVHYTTWLPPFRRAVEIHKIPTGQVKR